MTGEDPLRARLRSLAAGAPELAGAVAVYAELLPLVRDAVYRVEPLAVTLEGARERLSRGEPLLSGKLPGYDEAAAGLLLSDLETALAGRPTAETSRPEFHAVLSRHSLRPAFRRWGADAVALFPEGPRWESGNVLGVRRPGAPRGAARERAGAPTAVRTVRRLLGVPPAGVRPLRERGAVHARCAAAGGWSGDFARRNVRHLPRVPQGAHLARPGPRRSPRRGAGGVFGEMALVDQSQRAATATAATDCNLLSINRNDFLALIKTNPAFGESLLRALANRLRHTGRK